VVRASRLWPIPGYGVYNPGILCAKCINQCVTLEEVTQDDLDNCAAVISCVSAVNPLNPPDGTDFLSCNSVYVKTDNVPGTYAYGD